MAKKDKSISHLTSINGCTAQMRAVYRLARQNTPDEAVDPATAKTLVDILRTITAAYRDNDLEQRIAVLEKKS